MQEDTQLIQNIRDYIQKKPYASAWDIVQYFETKGVPPEKVLYVLKEIVD
jgi:hypothetical protein|tara:strand:- start:237 stop:386 length:150 start_codon:yes stop_codon:yes gene_type:complete